MDMRRCVIPEFVLGDGALSLVARYAAHLSAQRVLVVSDSGLTEAGWTERLCTVLAAAGVAHEVFDQVSANAPCHDVAAGAERCRAASCDVIVALGGGSVINCAKGIGIVAAASSGRDILSYEGVERIAHASVPLICVPSSAGASSQLSRFAVIRDATRCRKAVLISTALLPAVSLIDPQITQSQAPALLAASGVNVLVRAVEALVSTGSSPMTDLHALEAIRLVERNLVGALASPLDVRYRQALSLAGSYAELACSNASLGLAHAMAHSLSGLSDLSQSLCNAVLLPEVVAFNYATAAPQYLRIAQALGVDLEGFPVADQRRLLGQTLQALLTRVGMNQGFNAPDVRSADLARLAKAALQDPCIVTNPVQPSQADIERIYDRAFESR